MVNRANQGTNQLPQLLSALPSERVARALRGQGAWDSINLFTTWRAYYLRINRPWQASLCRTAALSGSREVP